MANNDNKQGLPCCLLILCQIILLVPFVTFCLWLSLQLGRPPVCSIDDFIVFALNSTAPNTTSKTNNHTIYFDLKLHNQANKDQGIYCDALHLTFYYKPNLTFPIANANFPGFCQARGKKKHLKNTTQVQGLDWNLAIKDASNGSAVFRADLKTNVRYTVWFWKSRWHKLEIGAHVPVNNQGVMIRKKKKKGIKLTSGVCKNMGFSNVVILVAGFLVSILNF